MKYIAYGSEPESVKVMIDSETVHIRMARNYQPPDNDQSTGQWEETYQQIPAREAPTKEQVVADEETWWNRGIYWEESAFSPTINERISAIESVLLYQILGETV